MLRLHNNNTCFFFLTVRLTFKFKELFFASRAVVGGVWYVRFVVMRHDPQDTTFKVNLFTLLANRNNINKINIMHSCLKEFKNQTNTKLYSGLPVSSH